MAKRLDVTGHRFGRLVAIEAVGKNKWGGYKWRCRCDCGNLVDVSLTHLKDGHTTSCKCFQRESSRIRETIHGMSCTPEYFAFKARERRYLEKQIDAQWTLAMEKALRDLFPACVLCGMTEIEHLELCGRKLSVDHVNPACLGFGLVPGNATILCNRCNCKKWGNPLEKLEAEWQAKLLLSAQLFKLVWEGEMKWQEHQHIH